ncbi:MAG: hypothetical protein AAB510_02160 [Patescibacteria group bacterium]
MNKEDVKSQIEDELEKREKSIRNKNAIEKFLGLFPNLDALYGVLTGSADAIEVERQKLTLDKVLDLVIAIDDKLSGKDISNIESGLKILIDNVVAGGNITGLEGDTSNETIQKIFEKPVDISIKNSQAGGNITGIKLNVDKEMSVGGKTKIETDLGTVEFNPEFGDITFGQDLDK